MICVEAQILVIKSFMYASSGLFSLSIRRMLHIYNGEKSAVRAFSLMHSALPVSESAEAGHV